MGLTVLSGTAFILHYLTVLTPDQLFTLLLNRFLGRSAVVHDFNIVIWAAYILMSFMAFICLPLILLLILIIVADKAKVKWGKSLVLRNNLWLLLIFLIPLIENIIMNQHAIAYSYDRMKMVFILSFFTADLVNIFVKIGYKKVITLVIAISIITSGINLYAYNTSQHYHWDAEYLTHNQEIADTIKQNFSDDEYVLGTNAEMGGYLNLLFNRGIHELITKEELIQIARENDKPYAIYLDAIDTPWNMFWNMAEITNFEIIEITE